MPASDIVVGTANICTNDTDIGYTEGGITLRYEPEYLDVTADQAFGTIAKRKTDEKMFIEFDIVEMSLDNIRKAMALPVDNVQGTCLILGAESSTCDDEVTVDLKMYGVGPDCCPRTWHFPQASPSEGFEISLSRTEVQRLSVTYEILKNDGGYFGLVCDGCSLNIADCSGVGTISTDGGGNVTIVPPSSTS